MKLSRRTFIEVLVGFSAGAGAGFLATPVNWKLMDDVAIWTQTWPWVPVPEKGRVSHVHTVCNLCPGGCGITVRKVEDRATKIEGREGYPVNNGGICPLGASGLQLLYGPWRVPSPMRRVGKRGSGKWERIPWETAIGEVVEHLSRLRQDGEPHSAACMLGSDKGTVAQLFDRFLKAYGSPNFIASTSAADTYELATGLMEGSASPRAYDLEGANFILSFGCGIIEGWGSPVRSIRAHSLWRSEKVNQQATVVQVEPRLSNTAAKADSWVPVNPGTEGALALGLAHVIIRDGLYDNEFIEKFAFGFEDCEDFAGRKCMGFKRLVMHRYDPATVSRITGVADSKIVDLARAFAKADRPLALWGRGKGTTPGSLYECMAIHALNALAGNINQPGGVTTRPPLAAQPWPAVPQDPVAVAGTQKPRLDGAGTNRYPLTRYLPGRLPEVINNRGKGEAIKALLIHEANPYYTIAGTSAMAKAFDRIPFIVSFSSYFDDSTHHADLILPNHQYLERWEDVPTPVGLNKPIISLRRPAVSPQFDTRHVGDVIMAVGKRLGGSVEAAFAWDSYTDLLQETMGNTWETLEETGYVEVTEFKVPSWDKAFLTASRKFEFYVTAFDQAGMKLPRDLDYLPHYKPIEPEGDADAYPLTLIPAQLMRLANWAVGNPPFCTKTLEENELEGNDLFIEVNPKTAAQNGLCQGQKALLETPEGKAEVLVHCYEGIMPGLVAIPDGLGRTGYDEYLAGKGVSANSLMGVVEDPVSGLCATWGIRAKLTQV